MFLDQEWEVIPLVDTRLTHWFLLFTDDEEAWTLRTEVTGGKSYADVLWSCGSQLINNSLEYTPLIINYGNLIKRDGNPMQEGAGKATINRIGEIRIAKVALETKLRAINHLIVEGRAPKLVFRLILVKFRPILDPIL